MFDQEGKVAAWREGRADADAGEPVLRAEMALLEKAGLTPEEAFLVAVKRLDEGRTTGAPKAGSGAAGNLLAVGVSVLAAALALVPQLGGIGPMGPYDDSPLHQYWRWSGFYAGFPLLLWFLGRSRPWDRWTGLPLVLMALVFAVATALPIQKPFDTATLTGWHLVVVVWYLVLLAYRGRDRSAGKAMDFVRTTGEALLFTALILLGGLVLVGLVLATFETIGIRAYDFVSRVMGPAGFFAAPVVGMILADSRRGALGSLAPVLAKIFSPLFLAALGVFLTFVALGGHNPFVDRNALGLSSLVLGVTLALVVYALSARKPGPRATASDALLGGLILGALVVGLGVLAGVAARIGTFGPSPNKVALLGLNLLLAANLGALALRLTGFFRGRGDLEALFRTQAGFLPVYAGWAAVMALAAPLLFPAG